MTLRYDDIAEIVKLIDASSCDEVVIETPELKLVVRRRGATNAATTPTPTPISSLAAPRPAPPAAGAARSESIATAGQTVLRAPMVGTFYRAPAPGATPFVEEGVTVKKGDALCLIEVMKLFTTIYAETAGRVAEILAENGKLVEYGQALFVIDSG
jgi:acetyl-CoA carboxylase biotin carboxyl carrier protein